MLEDERDLHEGLLSRGTLLAGHVAAVGTAPVLMFIGLEMCMSIVLMPIGVLVGLAGLLLFCWGLLGP